jgi:hypothetical protein
MVYVNHVLMGDRLRKPGQIFHFQWASVFASKCSFGAGNTLCASVIRELQHFAEGRRLNSVHSETERVQFTLSQ